MAALDHSVLFQPIRVGRVEVRNRLAITAHATHFGEAGLATDRHVHYHRERARGGVGMIVFEAIRVHPTTLPGWDAMAGWKPEIVPSLRRVVDAVHGEGARIFGQIVPSSSWMWCSSVLLSSRTCSSQPWSEASVWSIFWIIASASCTSSR